jgi:GntR family transcriptional regulator
MNIVISNTSADPIYQQIVNQISAQIIKGELPSDFCLPPIRTIAKELRISVITVKRAWEELEHAGLIYTMGGKGCFVSPLPTQALDDRRNTLAAEKLIKDIQYYKSLGLSLDEIIDLIKQYYERA